MEGGAYMKQKYQKMVCGVLIALALMVSAVPTTDCPEDEIAPLCILEEIYVSQ